MKETFSLQFNSETSSDISNILELALQNAGYDRERIIHYTFLLEEAVMKWKQNPEGDEHLTVTRENRRRDIVFTFSMKGDRTDPFYGENDSDMENDMNRVADRLLSGVGCELKYRYKRGSAKKSGENVLILRLPKDDVEKTLFRRMLMVLMVPMSLQMLIGNVASGVDTLMLSVTSTTDMSAVGLASGFSNMQLYMVLGVVVVETMLMSQFWGVRDRLSIRETLKFSFIVGLVLTAPFFVAGFFFPEKVMMFYTQTPELIEQGAVYLKYVSVSFLMIPFYRVCYCQMRLMGMLKETVIFTSAGCLINIILNSFLIYGIAGFEPIGVRGAGIATIASSMAQLLFVTVISIRKTSPLHENRERLSPEEKWKIRKTFICKVIPVTVHYVIYFAGMNLAAAALGHMGPDVVAANALITTVSSILMSFATGMGNSAGILTGEILGRREFDKAWRCSRISFRMAAELAMGVIALLVIIFFVLTGSVADLTDEAEFYLGLLTLACAVNSFFAFMNATSNNGCLYAGGDNVVVMFIDCAAMLLIIIPLSVMSIYTEWIPMIPAMLLLKTEEMYTAPFKYMRVKRKKWLRNIIE